MSKTSNLPIYKASYDILLTVMRITHNFPREYKYTLGERLQNELIGMMVSVYQIYNNKGEEKYFNNLNEHIELTFLYLRISHDMQLLNLDKYGELVEKLDNVLLQAKGWRNATQSKPELVKQ